MNKEILKNEILIQCQNVVCGAKLAAEIHYVYKEGKYTPEDIMLFAEVIKNFRGLKYFINYHPDPKAKKDGWKSLFIYKYLFVEILINEINDIKNKDSALYHFCNGKLFGYNDYEVMEFINKNNNGTYSK